ncbi:MAG: hypothetical protein Q8928_19370 [Bacteroidota bacterium]|nr:hypothetical protein [Bacteroidota bacterium]
MRTFWFLFVAVFLTYNVNVYAQDADSTQTENPTLHFTTGINYSSNSAYAGRDFGVSQYSISPYFKYKTKTGFYGMLSGSWLSAANPSYSSTNLELGFEKDLFSFMYFSAAYGRMFVNKPDSIPAQPVSNSVGLSASFSYKFLSLNTGYSYAFGDENAQGITLSLSGNFSKELKSFVNSISFAPSIGTVMGNSNIIFSKLTIKQYKKGIGANTIRQVGKKLKMLKSTSSSASKTITDNPFGILSYELAFPVTFSMKNFSLTAAYNYSIPQKVSSVDDTNLKNLSIFSLGLSYSF